MWVCGLVAWMSLMVWGAYTLSQMDFYLTALIFFIIVVMLSQIINSLGQIINNLQEALRKILISIIFSIKIIPHVPFLDLMLMVLWV